ncbi:MAG: metallophosphoesterase, partial [Gemmatimonadota bacterium]
MTRPTHDASSEARSGAARRLFLTAILLVSFVGCSSEPDFLRFVAMGDMGTGGPGQRKVAAVMAERARAEPIQFWLTLGDNIYPAGVLSPDSPEWIEKFESVYSDPALQVPVHPTLGNHDYLGLPLAQVQRSDRSAVWDMPGRYYRFSRFLSDGTEVAFFALDTEMILSGLTERIEDAPLGERMQMVRRIAGRTDADLSDPLVRYIAERVHVEDGWAVVRILFLASGTDREVSEAVVDEALAGSGTPDYPTQLDWLARELSESRARWKVVYGHHPLYGHNPRRGHSPVMIERLEPILVQGGADVYLAGHDHVLDMMKPIRGVHHITSGGGSGDD